MLLTVAVVLFLLLCTPAISMGITQLVERYPALTQEEIRNSNAKAIVILSAGRNSNAKEYNGAALSRLTLERIKYGAHIHELTGLPIVVSGGAPQTDHISEARIMKDVLVEDYGVDAQIIWIEDESSNTYENALYTEKILNEMGITHIFLTTHAWHMLRAVGVFTRFETQVTAAPTGFAGYRNGSLRPVDFLPAAEAFTQSSRSLREMLGRLWYKFRY
ncbi:MAG TPA: YdcF family protein [Gammaproteobacteria bacterium]